MARVFTTTLIFAVLALSINAQAPAATPEATPEIVAPATSPSVVGITANAPTIDVATPAEAPEISAPSTSPEIAPSTAPSNAHDVTPSAAPTIAPSVEAPGSEPYDFADGPIADGPDTTIDSPPPPPFSDAPATAPSSPSSAAIKTESGLLAVGFVASILAAAIL